MEGLPSPLLLRSLSLTLREENALHSHDVSAKVTVLPLMALVISRSEGALRWGRGSPGSRPTTTTLHHPLPLKAPSWCSSKSNLKI